MKNEIFSKEWCSIVFENRNKKYGAYVIRSKTGRRYAASILVVLGLFLCFVAPSVFVWMFQKVPPKKVDLVERLVRIEGIKLKEARPTRRPPVNAEPELSKKSIPTKDLEVPSENKLATILHPEDAVFNPDKIVDLPEDSAEVLLKEKDLKLAESTEQTDGVILDSIPHYPGGIVAFMKWLEKNLVYPPACVRKRMEGVVEVAFIVETNGNVADPRILRSATPELNHEALRVVHMMPKWYPAQKNGRKIRAQVTVPIVFEMTN